MMFRIGTPTSPHGDLVFGGFIFDWSWHENAGMQGLNAFIDGEVEIRNIRFEGIHSLGTHGNMRVATATSDSVALIESIDMSGGGLHFRDTINTRTTRRYGGDTDELDFGQSWSTTGMTGHPNQQGTTIFRNVISGPWPDNAIYVRGGTGRKIVSNCVAWNGGGCQIRTNGGNDWEPVGWLDGTEDKEEALNGEYPGSVVENSRCIVEKKPEGVYVTPRGLLLQDGPQTVRNCEIEIGYAEGGGAGGTYGLGTRGEEGDAPAGPAVFENCTITLHERTDAVYVSPYSNTIELRDIDINTVGWESGLDRLVGGQGADRLENVIVNTA
ncbi:hypothetical protein [Natronococcus jeotgali]|nr:hypothetical protein [Natronococcus jeotgali]